MFFDYRSQSLLVLAKAMRDALRESPNPDPLKPVWVVIQNKEAQQWLTLELAKLDGIAVNFEFVFPSELMWKLYRQSFPDTPKNLPSDRTSIHWQLFELLQSSPQTNIKGLNIPDTKEKCFHLAGQISDVFDLYQVYRPDLLHGWQNGRFSTIDKQEVWQAYLWNYLVKKWSNDYPGMPSRTEALKTMLNSLNDAPEIPELYVFGLSQFSSPFAELITSIAIHSDVHLFCADVDEDSEFRKWAQPQKHSFQVLNEFYLQKRIESKKITISSEEPDLIHTLEKRAASGALKIHSCHNPVREVRVLKDEFLKVLDKYPDLEAHEILIMVPDMDEYGPLIQNIFGFDEGEPKIPVTHPRFSQNPGAQTVTLLLDLLSGSFKVTRFMDFINTEVIKSRLNLNTEELNILRSWLIDNHIHWGLQDSDSSYSLEKAAHVFMGGFAMEPGDFQSFKNFIPESSVNTSSQSEIAAKYAFFVRFLIRLMAETVKEKPIMVWLELLSGWVEDLNSFSVTQDGSFSQVQKLLARLLESSKYFSSDTAISFSLFKEWVAAQLQDTGASSSGFGHGVMLSSYIPYRNIPFKYIAVLGFNEGTFPRNPIRPGFDLINKFPLPGDRITKEDDELLFLERLKSTELGIHFSYLGQDQHSENQRLPSILLQEFSDITSTKGIKIETRKHRLHAFDAEYFEKPSSYSLANKELSKQVVRSNVQSKVFLDKFSDMAEISEVHITELISFFSNPSKHFITRVLNLNDGYTDSELEDREAFNLQGLLGYTADHLIYEGIESDLEPDLVKEFALKKGILPLGLTGKKEFDFRLNDLLEMTNKVGELRLSEDKAEEIELDIQGCSLTGTVDHVYDQRRVIFRLGKLRAKDLIPAWIMHLVLNAGTEHGRETLIITKEKSDNGTKITTSVFSEVKDPEVVLSQLLNWYLSGISEHTKLAFFPDTSKAYYDSLVSGKEGSDLFKKAYEAWLGSEYSFTADGADFYNALAWRGLDPIATKEFRELAELFWAPVLKHFEEKT